MTRTFTAYAAPMSWGPELQVASHIGSVTYTISYEGVGNALVLGRVHYFKTGTVEKVTESLISGARITTADVVANVEVEFRGVPTGSAVNGTISP